MIAQDGHLQVDEHALFPATGCRVCWVGFGFAIRVQDVVRTVGVGRVRVAVPLFFAVRGFPWRDTVRVTNRFFVSAQRPGKCGPIETVKVKRSYSVGGPENIKVQYWGFL